MSDFFERAKKEIIGDDVKKLLKGMGEAAENNPVMKELTNISIGAKAAGLKNQAREQTNKGEILAGLGSSLEGTFELMPVTRVVRHASELVDAYKDGHPSGVPASTGGNAPKGKDTGRS